MMYSVVWDAKNGGRPHSRNFRLKREAVALAKTKPAADLHKVQDGMTVSVECFESGRLVWELEDMG